MKYAKKWKIPCLSQEWVFDSIEKGYCLNSEGYRIENTRGSTSTPTKVSLGRVLPERYSGKMKLNTGRVARYTPRIKTVDIRYIYYL